ncbi:hypothetical protein [Acidiphilium sp. C61]|uniref:hypothetical protein n=1 Tax=Acidiphilium sp. C61 TaxID=1671485 RepID=UPI00157B5D0D|nr:hypothetical protein [Acidiphilium sp. C61]
MNSDFTVTYRNGCALLQTPDDGIPPMAMSALTALVGMDVVADRRLADITGASLVTGSREALAKLRTCPDIIAAAETAVAPALAGLTIEITPEFRDWLVFGIRHPFTDAMCRALTGVDLGGDMSVAHPTRTSHLLACRLMLDRMPALQARFDTLASLSPEWRAIVVSWDRLCAAADVDYPEWRQPRKKRGPGRPPSPGTSCQEMLDQILANPDAVAESDTVQEAAE